MILIDTGQGSSSSTRTAPNGFKYDLKGLNDTPPLDKESISCSLSIDGETYRADVLVIGKGPNGPIRLGIEVKTYTDLVSSLKTGRLQAGLTDGIQDGQLSHLKRCYDLAFLLIYGQIERNPSNGALQTWSKSKKAFQDVYIGSQLVPYGYHTAFLCGPGFLSSGVNLVQLSSLSQAAEWISCLHRTWSKPWDSHKSTRVLDQSQVKSLGMLDQIETKPGENLDKLRRRIKIASCLPNVGYEGATSIAKHFASTRDMINATEEELASIDIGGSGNKKKSRKLGTKIARKIVDTVS